MTGGIGKKAASWCVIALCSSLISIAGPSMASAQGTVQNLLGTFGNAMHQIQEQQHLEQQRELYQQQIYQHQQQQLQQEQQIDRRNAAAAWSRLGADVLSCLQEKYGIDGPQIGSTYGLFPNDARYSPSVRHCARAVAAEREKKRQRAEAERQRRMQLENAQREEKLKEDEEQRQAELKAQEDAAEAARKARADHLVRLRGEFSVAQLLGDPPDGVTVLVVGHDTKRVVRNLSGDPTFVGRPAACYPFSPFSLDPSDAAGRFHRYVVKQIEKKGGHEISLNECSPRTFGQFDLVIFTRDQFGSITDPNDLQPLVSAIKDGSLIKFGIYNESDFQAEQQASREALEKDQKRRNAERLAARQEFEKRTATDISAIYVKMPAASACIGAPNEENGLVSLLKKPDSPFSDLVNQRTTLIETATANRMFLAYKEHDCDAIIALTGMLKEMLPALQRDSVPFQFHPGSIDSKRLAESKNAAQ